MDKVIPETFVDRVFSHFGLSEPGMRFLTTFASTSALILALKPGFSFTADGCIDPNSYVPWWGPGFVLGAIAATFI